MDYDEQIRDPGKEISSGQDLFDVFGYTDTRNPYVGFDLMNDSYFKSLEDMIKEKKVTPEDIPDRYNANIIRLRDYQLGEMLNGFRDLCNAALTRYEEEWSDYQTNYNTDNMPEDFYHFWMLYDSTIHNEILPKYINLIDPVSMTWIDPEYEKVTYEDGKYQYKLNQPIRTSDPKFLYPDTKMTYFFHEPRYNPITWLYDELAEEVPDFLPDAICKACSMGNHLIYNNPNEGETEEDFIRRTKWQIRYHYRKYPNLS